MPDLVLSRAPTAGGGSPPSLFFSILYGGLSFGLVSAVAYSIWAFGLIRDTGTMYASIAVIYIGLTGLALGRLVIGRGAMGRFALLFAVAFLAYALVWCAFWFGLKGKHHADLFGSAVGLAAMTALLRAAFGRGGEFLAMCGVLFAFHTLGYTLGDVCHVLVPGPTGRLLWGAAHGVGFGAGLGYVLYSCQAPLRARLESN